MKFTTKVTVVGMKSSKGTLENGQAYDSTKAYVLTDMDESKGRMIGQSTAEYGIGDSAEFDKFAHLPFPLEAEADFEVVTTGKTTRTTVTGLRPVSLAKVAPKV